MTRLPYNKHHAAGPWRRAGGSSLGRALALADADRSPINEADLTANAVPCEHAARAAIAGNSDVCNLDVGVGAIGSTGNFV
eukprot:3803648-Amphidinium_carterae.1